VRERSPVHEGPGVDEAETRRVARALYDAYAAGDLEAMLALMDDDVEVVFLAQARLRRLSAVRRFIDFSAGLLIDLDWRLEKLIVEGDTACGLWYETATTFDGHPWASPGVDVIRVRHGRVVSLKMNNDAALSRRHFPRYEGEVETG
jgi:ketosteroid isomerase-like protein